MPRKKTTRVSGDVVVDANLNLIRKPWGAIYFTYRDPQTDHSAEASCRTDDLDEARRYREKLVKNLHLTRKVGADMTGDDLHHLYHSRKTKIILRGDNPMWGPCQSLIGHLRLRDPRFVAVVNDIAEKRLLGTPVLDFSARAKKHSVKRADPHTVKNWINYIKRMVMFAANNSKFPMEAALEICVNVMKIDPDDDQWTRNPRIAKNFRIGRANMEKLLIAAKDVYLKGEQRTMPDGSLRHSVTFRLLMICYYGGGTRSARCGALPWCNITLTGVQPNINFADLDAHGIRTSKKKKAFAAFRLKRADFLLFMKKCEAQRIGDYFLDDRHNGTQVWYAVNKLLKSVLGLKGGGMHLLRKEVINELADQGRRDLIPEYTGVSLETAERFYIIANPERADEASAIMPTFDLNPTPADSNVVALPKKA